MVERNSYSVNSRLIGEIVEARVFADHIEVWYGGLKMEQTPTYGIAISKLKAEGKCPKETVHRQVKYLNNIVEADHGKLKQLIRPVRGFKTR